MGIIDVITSVPGLRCLDDCDEWCVGLPLDRVRVLDDTEIARLTAAVNRQYRRQRATATGCACNFAVLYLCDILYPDRALFLLTAVDGIAMAALVLWLVSAETSWLRRNRALQADITAGVVHCFHHGSCAGPLEVLPRAEVVYKPNEFSPGMWKRARITSTAKTPPISSIASEWLQPVEGTAGHFLAGKRELSTGEIAEIRRFVDSTMRSPRRNAIATVIWLTAVTSIWRSTNVDLVCGAVLLTGVSLLRSVPDVLCAIALSRDVHLGHVIINRRVSRQDSAFVPIGNSAEYLPAAKMKWTDGGQPAEWRKFA